MSPADARRLLRWYPRAWRERYGEELIATVEDQLGARPPSPALRFSLARAGVAQRLRDTGLIGRDVAAPARIRGGVRAILWAWTLFVLAGCGLAKTAEHWREATPHGDRLLPSLALGLVQCVACASLGVLALAALVLAAPLRELVRGGWRELRPALVRALLLSVLTAGVGAAVVVWAHTLGSADRNGADAGYALAAIALACCVAASAFAWTSVASRAVRRVRLQPPTVVRIAPLACLVALALPLMLAGTIVWWAALGNAAPWFLDGGATGAAASPWAPQLIAVVAAMTVACALAAVGAARIVGARPYRQAP
jgi:hypothetical protein